MPHNVPKSILKATASCLAEVILAKEESLVFSSFLCMGHYLRKSILLLFAESSLIRSLRTYLNQTTDLRKESRGLSSI